MFMPPDPRCILGMWRSGLRTLVFACVALGLSAHGEVLVWDPLNAGSGGSTAGGTWSTLDSNWYLTGLGGGDSSWLNTMKGAEAHFLTGGTGPYPVTLGSNIEVRQILVGASATGYSIDTTGFQLSVGVNDGDAITANASLNLLGTGSVDMKSDIDWNVVNAGTSLLVVPTITGSAGNDLLKSGAGRLVLAGNNTYAGATQVTEGELQVGAKDAGQTGTGAVTIKSGGTLLGTGIVRGSTNTINGTLQAGGGTTTNDHGTLTFTPATTNAVNGNVILDLSGSTNAVLDPSFGGNAIGSKGYANYVTANGTGAGSHDRLVFNGSSTTFGFGSSFDIISSAGFVPEAGQIFNLMDWLGVMTLPTLGGPTYRNGSEDNATNFDLPDISSSGLLWDTSLFTSHGIIVVVPEPGRVFCLTMGLALLVIRRRR